MNEREKYIANLATYLKPLTDDERNDALEFYDEYIVDAGLASQAAIEEKLGTPRQLSYKILADYSIKSNEESKKDGRPGSTHSSWRVFWWVLIAIITSPITFGLGIVMLGILIMAVSLVAGLAIGAVGLVLGLIFAAGVTIYSGVGVIASAPFTGLFYLGVGLSMLGLFFVCLPLLYWFIRLLVQGVANLAKYLYNKIQARRGNK
jgi:uncharacterized membrane protein